MIKRRKPQPRCKCGHARSKHREHLSIVNQILTTSPRVCCYCFDDCVDFTQDNLRTLEKLYQYAEETKDPK